MTGPWLPIAWSHIDGILAYLLARGQLWDL
jgi:hypothetical protein